MFAVKGVESMGKESFILYDSDVKSLEYLTDAQAGKLFKSIAKYRQGATKPDLGKNPAVNILYDQIINHININEEKYKELCAKRTQAANKRWVKPQNQNMHRHANASTSMQMDASGCLYDNDNVNDNDNDIVNVNDNDNVACGTKRENKKYNYYNRKNNVPALLRDEPSYDAEAFMRKAINLQYKKREPPDSDPPLK